MPDSNGMMSPQEVEAFRLAQYLRNQAPQQQAQPTAGTGALLGNAAGMYAGSKILGSGAATQGQLTSEGIAAITGENGLFTPVAQNMSLGSATAPEAVGSSFAGSALPIGAAAIGTYLGGKAGLDMINGKKPGLPGRVILGMATGGISEIANALFNKPSTHDIAKKHTKSLLGTGKDNPAWQQYVQGMRKQYESAPTGPAYAGKYNTFDEYKKAGLDAGDLTGVYGNLKTFGPDWAGYGMDRQKQIVQALIDNNLYESKKGEVGITDAVKAQALRDQILKTNPPKPTLSTLAPPIVNLGSTAPIVTFTEGVNGTKIPVFAPSAATIAKYEAINAAKGIKK